MKLTTTVLAIAIVGIASISQAKQISFTMQTPPELSKEQEDVLYDLWEKDLRGRSRLALLNDKKSLNAGGFISIMMKHRVNTSHGVPVWSFDPSGDPCSPSLCQYCFAFRPGYNPILLYRDLSGGWCHHYNADGANDGTFSGLSFPEFLKALESTWFDDQDVYTKLTKAYIDEYQLEVLEFEYVLQFSTGGGGGSGTASKSVTFEVGRSQEKEITSSTMYKIGSSIGNDLASANFEAQHDFSSVETWAEDTRYEETFTYELDLSVANYVYQKVVTMRFFSGRTETIQMEKHISHEPETYRKTIKYNHDGSIASTTVIP